MEDLPSLVDVELLGLVPADRTIGVEGVRVVRMHRVDAPRRVDNHRQPRHTYTIKAQLWQGRVFLKLLDSSLKGKSAIYRICFNLYLG